MSKMLPVAGKILFLFGILSPAYGAGILFPQESETRETKSLDAIWNFRIGDRLDPELGFREEWYKRPLSETGETIMMPVPSSYNDLTQSKAIRDYIGWAWYDTEFWVPKSWLSESQRKINIRFGGVNYNAVVWVNGIQVVEHSGGHLPFAAELDPSATNLSGERLNRITVAINNTLTQDTIPQGSISRPGGDRYPPGYFTLNYNFDFFNYAGIHRSVYLFTTPINHIDDITVSTKVEQDGTGFVEYSIEANSTPDKSVSVALVTKAGAEQVATGNGPSGTLRVTTPNLWWPFSMVKNDSDAGYLYTLVVTLKDTASGTVEDLYRLKVGIRDVAWSNTSFTINGRPFYFRGFGRHEDFDIRGRGIDNVMIVKDHNLVKWTGANSYRTSHYPYSEEIMDLTDELGIVIIDEISAVSIDGFGANMLETHKQQLRKLVQRDKNRASVVMWSVANEPRSTKAEARPYFKEIFDLARSLDTTRPITIVLDTQYADDLAAENADIICVNRYFSWYTDTGHTEVITSSMIQDIHNWVNKYNKPVLISEYGADTISGLHMSPEFVFTEEYQLEYMREHFKAFDTLRMNTTFIGEMIWNFADFMTAQGITRIVGNRKGIFTRERQPKASAHLLRTRYHMLAQEFDAYPYPDDLPSPVPIYIPGNPRHSEL